MLIPTALYRRTSERSSSAPSSTPSVRTNSLTHPIGLWPKSEEEKIYTCDVCYCRRRRRQRRRGVFNRTHTQRYQVPAHAYSPYPDGCTTCPTLSSLGLRHQPKLKRDNTRPHSPPAISPFTPHFLRTCISSSCCACVTARRACVHVYACVLVLTA